MPGTLLGRRSCPNLQNGGVMVFFHVAKAGGTTIREVLSRVPHVTVKARANLDAFLPLMKRWVHGKHRSEVLAIEIHDGPNPALVNMAVTLRRLRASAEQNGVPFFVFTTVREPLSYAVSFYNYQNMGSLVNGPRAKYAEGQATEEDFRRLSLTSPQCMFFARGEEATTLPGRLMGQNLTVTECRKTYQVITQTVDWVGLMESMSGETLPLLTHMLCGDKEIGRAAPILNRQNSQGKIDAATLSREATDYIRSITEGDRELYARASVDYTLEMWTDLS